MSDPIEVTLAVWEIQYSKPRDGGGYRYNRPINVVADTLERAVVIFRETHPDASLHAVQKRTTTTDMLVDSAIIERLRATE